jgi:hypothetical protein
VWWLIAAGVVLLLAGGVTLGALVYLGKTPVSVPGVSHFTVNGDLQIVGGDCGGLGYGDITTGTEVTLTDDSGKVISVGQLMGASACKWTFTLADVPAGGKFYGITISHRGTLHYTEAQLRQGVHLSL